MTSEFLESLPSSGEVAEFFENYTRGCAPLPAISMSQVRQWAGANGVHTKTEHEVILAEVTRTVNRLISAAILLPEENLTGEKWRHYLKPLCPQLLYKSHSRSIKKIAKMLSIQSVHIELIIGWATKPVKSAAAILVHDVFRLTIEAWEFRSERHLGQMSFEVDVRMSGGEWTVINVSA